MTIFPYFFVSFNLRMKEDKIQNSYRDAFMHDAQMEHTHKSKGNTLFCVCVCKYKTKQQ